MCTFFAAESLHVDDQDPLACVHIHVTTAFECRVHHLIMCVYVCMYAHVYVCVYVCVREREQERESERERKRDIKCVTHTNEPCCICAHVIVHESSKKTNDTFSLSLMEN